MDENERTDELTDRLHALGDEPVPDAVRAQHLQRIASTPVDTRRGFGRTWVAAAAIVGFLAGSTGLAAAGALPDSAQDVAHDVLAVVQVDVPEGKRGPCVSAIAKSALPKAEKKAAKDACPKGGNGGDDIDDDDAPGKSGDASNKDKHANDPCKGKPPWAGKNSLTPQEKDAMKAERAATCGKDLDDDGDDDEIHDEAEEPEDLDEGKESAPKKSSPTTVASDREDRSVTTDATETTETTTTQTTETTIPADDGSGSGN